MRKESIKIISGGQTGVDRAALDVAIELGIDYGGSVPKGKTAENGIVPLKYDKQTISLNRGNIIS
jgi:predicted Rossmann-fold nucleotide-binding protein